MENPNPIRYSDLIKPDSSITDLIAQLNALIAKYEEMKGKISASASDLAKSLGSMSGATEQQREAIAGISEQSEKLAREYKAVADAQRSASLQEQRANAAKREATQIDKLLVQLQKSKEGSYNRLSAQYRLNKIRLNEMSLAERQGTEAGRQLETETRLIYEEMSRLQKATGKYTLEVGHYENALRRLPGPLGSVVNSFTQMRASVRGLANSDLPLGVKAFQGFGVILGGVVGMFAMLGRYVTGSIKTLREFEQANADLSTILGVSRSEMTALTESAKSLGRTTEYTASQVTELQTALAKLGFKEGQIMGMQKSILQFATAVGANLGEAAEVAGSTLRAFNLTSADTDDVLGTLAVATNNSALSFEKIRTSIGTVFPVANAFGLSVKDATALLGSLANAGFDASTAATSTRNILLNLSDANGKLAQKLGGSARSFDEIMTALQKLKEEGVDLAEALGLTDKRSVAAFTSFLSGAESAKELRASLEDVSGELDRIQSQRLDTLEGSAKLMKSAWEGLTLAFEESNGVFKDTVDWLTRVIQKTQELLFPTQTAEANYRDQYEKQFLNVLKKAPANAQEIIDSEIKTLRRRRDKAYNELAKSSPLDVIGTAKKAKRLENLDIELKAAEQAGENTKKLIREQEEERKKAATQALKDEKDKQDKLKKEQEKAAQKAAQQRIKDRQAVVDSINMEIAATEKGTEEMLEKRLDKVEAERQLELERNRQRVKSERRDEAAINAKFDADALKVRQQHEKEVSEIKTQRLQADQQAIQLQLAVTEKGTEQELALRLAANEKARQIELEQNKQKTVELRQSEAAINAKYNKLALQTEADFRTALAQRDLKAMQDLQQAEFDMLDKNERQKTEFRLDQEKARLQSILDINEKATNKMTQAEIDAIKKTIEGIDEQKKRLGFNNIYELLGISLDDDQQSALNSALGSIKDSIDSIIDSWKDAADAARSTADAQVDAAQRMLDAEIEARQQGYASREETARKELELAKSNQAAAIKEQKKAQRAQMLIDSAMQASSLVTASANIWKALSGITPIGPALAIAAIGTMWGSFAAAKIRAAQVTEQYGEGTVELLQGGSHASGHDIDLGTKKDGTRRRAEGGEYFAVINKRNSRKYGSLIPEVINSLNNGTFSERFAKAGEEMAGAVLAMGGNTNIAGLEKDVRAIRQQGEESRYTDRDGNTIIRYRNLTRKIKS